jgi:selenocysteine-specific elongation factor
LRALTGVHTHRLPEEKRRGITIELGFAPLVIDGIGTLGIVDVPGHEAFVRTMLAGATGIDLALLVIAADEGVMPQTLEHLAILSLLGVRDGVIALTKRDLVDDEWLALVTEDVRALVKGTLLEPAELVSVSAVSGDGLEGLRDAIARAARRVPERARDDLFRLPVDRAFSIRGTGTVVTGTVWSGTLRRDEVVRILPGGREARVRTLQHHGESVESVGPGERAAVALAGVEVSEMERGCVVVRGGWTSSTLLRGEVALLDSAPRTLGPRSRIRFHLGTADVGARVVAPGGLAPGERRPARLILDEPVVARAGDRFVLRTPSPAVTIGGGIVEDPAPSYRRARPIPQAGSLATRLERLLDEAGAAGIDRAILPIRVGAPPSVVTSLVKNSGDAIVVIGDRLYPRTALEAVSAEIHRLIDEHHRARPLDPGPQLQSIRSAVHVPPGVIDTMVTRAVEAGVLETEGAIVRRRGWRPSLTSADEGVRDRVHAALLEAGREPPAVTELTALYGDRVPALLRILERAGVVVPVAPDRYYATEVLQRLVDQLRAGMEAGREYSPAELRDLLGVSRKYLIPLLEYCDRVGVTDRRVAGRVIGGTSFAGKELRQET